MLNALGYYGVFVGLHYQNDLAMMKALDADTYDASQTITIQFPVSIPYMPDQADFKRVNGKFEHQGEFYRLIKQKYAHDTLTVVCVKDTEHKKIDNALADYVKTFTDKAADGKSTSKITFNFIKDYIPTTFAIGSTTSGWTTNVIHNSACGTLTSSFFASIVHPPERA